MTDTITTGVADVGVPFFVTIIFVLSYLFWAKFRYGGKLRIDFDSPNAVDNVAEVLLIFASLLLTFIEIPLAFAALVAVRDIDLGLPRISSIWTGTTSAVVVLGCAAIIIMLGANLHKRPRQNRIWLFLRAVVGLHVGIVAIVIGLFISAMVRTTPVALRQQLFLLSFAVAIISYVSCFPLAFFSKLVPAKPVKYGSAIMVGIVVAGCVIGFMFGTFSSPTYEYSAPIVKQYFIAQQWSGPDAPTAAAALTEITVNLTSTGKIGPFFNLAHIPYDGTHLQHHDGTDFSFGLKTVDTQGNKAELADGVNRVNHYDDAVPTKHGILHVWDNANDSIVFWFDKEELAYENITGLSLEGPVDLQLNESQYARSSSTTCNEHHHCTTVVNISNALDAPVLDRNYFITTLRTLNLNASACQFLNVSASASGLSDPRNLIAYCYSGDQCNLETHGQVPDLNIDIALTDGNINVRYIKLQQPVNVSITLDVQC
jgi:hypothetical protein